MTEQAKSHRVHREPSLRDALIPVMALVIFLAGAILIYGEDAIFGPVQVALVICMIIAGIVGFKNGHSVSQMTKYAVDSIASALGAIFILFAVGALIGAWSMSGTIATMAAWGIQILSPSLFYVTAALICAAIALGIGSSWTVMGTIGVALIGISEAIGLSPAMTAGAVISGAYFGDKMSPLSETTNLAPAVAGTDLYTHIRAMLLTTVPSILLALGLFLVIGFFAEPDAAFETDTAVVALESIFTINAWMLLPLLVVIVLAVKKIPPVVAILAGAITGAIIAVIFQPDVVRAFVGDDSMTDPVVMIKGAWDSMANGFVSDSGIPAVDDLVSRGGMESMLNTVWLIMVALAFGGIMNGTGLLAKIIEPIHKRAKTDRSVMVATGTTAIGVNVLAADQYLAIVLTGNVYKQDFEDRGIAPQSLSRQIEDTATITSVLVPWNSCGAYASGVLGVSTVAYFPFAFFNLINPILSFIFAAMGIGIKRTHPHDHFPAAPHDTEFYGVAGQHGDELPDKGD